MTESNPDVVIQNDGQQTKAMVSEVREWILLTRRNGEWAPSGCQVSARFVPNVLSQDERTSRTEEVFQDSPVQPERSGSDLSGAGFHANYIDQGHMSRKGVYAMSEAISDESSAGLPLPKKWNHENLTTVTAALTFVNNRHLHAGEISATIRNDGTVGLFYFL